MRKSTTAVTWIAAVGLGLLGSIVYKRVVVAGRMTVERRVGEYETAWKTALNQVARMPPPRADEALTRAPRWQRKALKVRLAELDGRFQSAYDRKAGQIGEGLQSKFRGQWEEALEEAADPPAIDAFLKDAGLHEALQTRVKKELETLDADMRKKHPRIRLAIDSFSGYCVFRSRAFHRRLARDALKLHLVDDDADYKKRIKSLQSNDTPLAVFTVDALINNSALFDDPPATIVLVLDVSRGADALVADGRSFRSLEDVNRKEVKIVLTPDSPSETLARVVLSRFNRPLVPADWIVAAKDAGDVYTKFREDNPAEPRAYALWEPYVSRVLKDFPHARVLIDSATLRDYIVDVLVVNRQYLRQHPQVVDKIVRAYLESAQPYRQPADRARLVEDDSRKLVKAKKLSEALTPEEAAKVVRGIWWKTTDENWAHFDLPGAQPAERCPPLSEIIKNINAVLIQTKAVSREANPELLYDRSVLARLKVAHFDPVADPWKRLKPVADQPPRIEFGAGGSDVPPLSAPELDQLAETMKKNSDYYLEVRGHAKKAGEADRALAVERAAAVVAWLKKKGVEAKRLRHRADVGGDAPAEASVSFRLLQGQLDSRTP